MAVGMTLKLTLVLVAVMVGPPSCASTPTGPSVMTLPGAGKSHDQCRSDDSRCRQIAAMELQTTPKGAVSAQGRYDVIYMQCRYAEGNQIPVPDRGWRSRDNTLPRDIPRPPAGTPPAPPPAPVR
jgi:hypothetical protein